MNPESPVFPGGGEPQEIPESQEAPQGFLRKHFERMEQARTELMSRFERMQQARTERISRWEEKIASITGLRSGEPFENKPDTEVSRGLMEKHNTLMEKTRFHETRFWGDTLNYVDANVRNLTFSGSLMVIGIQGAISELARGSDYRLAIMAATSGAIAVAPFAVLKAYKELRRKAWDEFITGVNKKLKENE